jgi:hypothetical protein
MKKYQAQLLKLANKFYNKYAQSQTLEQIIENAASYGEGGANGIMNFQAQLDKDNANLLLVLIISTDNVGGYDFTVGNAITNPPQFTQNYSKLGPQVKSYLEKNINNFPQIQPGTYELNFGPKNPRIAKL